MDKLLHYYEVWDEIIYPFPNFNDATVEVWERISNFIPHFTYPCWDYNSSMFVKGDSDIAYKDLRGKDAQKHE